MASLNLPAHPKFNDQISEAAISNEQSVQPSEQIPLSVNRSNKRLSRKSHYGKLSKNATIFEKIRAVYYKTSMYLKMVNDSICRYLRGVYRIALVRDPIAFSQPDDFNSAGERIKTDKDEKTLDMVEIACNYSAQSKALLDGIIAERKDIMAQKKKITTDIDFALLPPWNESFRERLESTFTVFDTSGDGLVDYDEMTQILGEFGDTSSNEDRRIVFTAADTHGKGVLNFHEFATMIHNITVKSPDTAPPTLVETFTKIDRNMARIRSLDVVQQLQAGLF